MDKILNFIILTDECVWIADTHFQCKNIQIIMVWFCRDLYETKLFS